MALIVGFEKDDREFRSLHPTEVVCKYILTEMDGRKVLQLNTYGSSDRENPNKLSQTIQLDESAAQQLLSILRSEF